MAKQITIEEDGCEPRTVTVVLATKDGKIPSKYRNEVPKMDLVLVETPNSGEKKTRRTCKILKDRYQPMNDNTVLLIPARHHAVFTDTKISAGYQRYTNILIVQNN